MAWLIRERAKLNGMIGCRKKQLEDLPREIVELQSKQDALDAVIPLHEVKVDPKITKGTKPKKKALLPYGVLTRMIYRVLREAEGQTRFSSEIAIELLRKAGVPVNHETKVYAMRRVSHRLGNMARDGLRPRLELIKRIRWEKDVPYWRLAENLSALGLEIEEQVLINRVSCGRYYFAFALQLLAALGIETLAVPRQSRTGHRPISRYVCLYTVFIFLSSLVSKLA